MNSNEWKKCANRNRMLEAIPIIGNERKFRLFAGECVRRIWPLLEDPASRLAVEISERFADSSANEKELVYAHQAGAPERLMKQAAYGHKEASTLSDRFIFKLCTWMFNLKDPIADPKGDSALSKSCHAAMLAAYYASEPDNDPSKKGLRASVQEAAQYAVQARGLAMLETNRDEEPEVIQRSAEVYEELVQCQMIRDIFGNPFSNESGPSVIYNPNEHPEVVSMARSIYDDRTFERVPDLANVLESSGITDPVILHHCRSEPIHIRGCWVLDQILEMK